MRPIIAIQATTPYMTPERFSEVSGMPTATIEDYVRKGKFKRRPPSGKETKGKILVNVADMWAEAFKGYDIQINIDK